MCTRTESAGERTTTSVGMFQPTAVITCAGAWVWCARRTGRGCAERNANHMKVLPARAKPSNTSWVSRRTMYSLRPR
jgi:hypothetical protein